MRYNAGLYKPFSFGGNIFKVFGYRVAMGGFLFNKNISCPKYGYTCRKNYTTIYGNMVCTINVFFGKSRLYLDIWQRGM